MLSRGGSRPGHKGRESEVLYVIDADFLMGANRGYLAMDRVPQFWDWLQHVGREGHAKLPLDICDEIRDGTDALAAWIRDAEVREDLLLAEEADPALVSAVVDEGYANDLTDTEVEKLGRDPFLIAHVLGAPESRCVVSNEVSKPSAQRANRHVPDVCADLGLRCIDGIELIRRLDFRTDWRDR